jgi:kynurenine formamidase
MANAVDPDPTSALIDTVRSGLEVIDMAHVFHAGMPTSPNHPGFRLSYLRRHGDMTRPDGGSAANEMIVTGGHVGTHVDALAHVSQQGRLFGDVPVADAFREGRFQTHGIDKTPPIITRGLFLDIPRLRNESILPAAHGIGSEELSAACDALGTRPQPSDAVIVRTGWGQHFTDDHQAYLGQTEGVPGVTAEGAQWLAEHRIAVTGADTTAYEHIAAGQGHSVLPAHRVLLVESGIPIVEHMNLEPASHAGLGIFVFVLAPLPILGGTGSPVRPLALRTSTQ